ncbi:MAG: hypothetical protein Q4P08_00895 [Eubacteriales bacterium]|nr:hypothetical protein [Eubacteriales bacterium]
MQFTLETALTVPLTLLLIVSCLVYILPLDQEQREQSLQIAECLVLAQQADQLYERSFSPKGLVYVGSSAQRTVEFMTLFLDLKAFLKDGLDLFGG